MDGHRQQPVQMMSAAKITAKSENESASSQTISTVSPAKRTLFQPLVNPKHSNAPRQLRHVPYNTKIDALHAENEALCKVIPANETINEVECKNVNLINQLNQVIKYVGDNQTVKEKNYLSKIGELKLEIAVLNGRLQSKQSVMTNETKSRHYAKELSHKQCLEDIMMTLNKLCVERDGLVERIGSMKIELSREFKKNEAQNEVVEELKKVYQMEKNEARSSLILKVESMQNEILGLKRIIRSKKNENMQRFRKKSTVVDEIEICRTN